jgi:uncharacterized RDD family membrane protein YckC
MHCKHCGFANGEDDHRCLRCGRRLTGIVISAPPGYSGANALKIAPSFDALPFDAAETQDFLPLPAAEFPRRVRPVQPGLFAGRDQKVIPFDQIQRHVTGRLTSSPAAPLQEPAAPPPPLLQRTHRVSAKKPHGPGAEQTTMDFVQSSTVQRTLKDDVPAQIFCEQAVATVQHRMVAAGVDCAMILLSFGVFAGIVEASGAGFGEGNLFWMMLSSSFLLVSLFYGLIWAIAGRETLGMDWTELQLITFDGHPVDAPSRAIRFASTWLSFCSGGLGLVWAVADEENLTWHDHISKTFPTFRDVPRNVVRPRQ